MVQNARTIDSVAGGDELARSYSTQLSDRLARRPSAVTDGNFLLTLFAESRPELALVPEAVRRQLIRMQFESQRTQYRDRAPDAVEWILELDHGGGAEPVGRCYLWRRPQEHRLLDLAIRSRWRRHGLASSVLAQLCADAAQAGVPLRLTVWQANQSAFRLYQRHGFVADDAATGLDDDVPEPAGYLRLRWSAEGRR